MYCASQCYFLRKIKHCHS